MLSETYWRRARFLSPAQAIRGNSSGRPMCACGFRELYVGGQVHAIRGNNSGRAMCACGFRELRVGGQNCYD